MMAFQFFLHIYGFNVQFLESNGYFDQSRFKSIDKCSVFIIFECSHDAVSKRCRLEFRFQTLPFSESTGKNVPFSCEQEAHLSHFSPFSECTSIV